jgi:hypothetical protein
MLAGTKAVFLNRRDASRYRDYEKFRPGPEMFWNFKS